MTIARSLTCCGIPKARAMEKMKAKSMGDGGVLSLVRPLFMLFFASLTVILLDGECAAAGGGSGGSFEVGPPRGKIDESVVVSSLFRRLLAISSSPSSGDGGGSQSQQVMSDGRRGSGGMNRTAPASGEKWLYLISYRSPEDLERAEKICGATAILVSGSRFAMLYMTAAAAERLMRDSAFPIVLPVPPYVKIEAYRLAERLGALQTGDGGGGKEGTVNALKALLAPGAGKRRAVQTMALNWQTELRDVLRLADTAELTCAAEDATAIMCSPIPDGGLTHASDWMSQQSAVVFVEEQARYKVFNEWAKGIMQGWNGTGAMVRTPIFDQGLRGEGEVIGLADTGIDMQHCFFYDENKPNPPYNIHDPLRRKVVQYITFGDSTDGTQGGHGTHVAGSLAGDTLIGNQYSGMAPAAKIAFFDVAVGDDDNLLTPISLGPSLFAYAREAGARIHSNSWGTPYNGYGSDARAVDEYSYKNEDVLLVFAAGNQGENGSSTIASPGLAKNCITVGASYNAKQSFEKLEGGAAEARSIATVAPFSSQGPTTDGRLKPDVVAPGMVIWSSYAQPGVPPADNCAFRPKQFDDQSKLRKTNVNAAPFTDYLTSCYRVPFDDRSKAKLKAIADEQAAKMKRLEEEMKRVQQEEEERRKAAKAEGAAEEEKERMRIESGEGSSGGMMKWETDTELEKKISEWVANLSLGEDEEAESYVTKDEKAALAAELATMIDPMERREREDEQKLAWKLRMKREKKRRREEVNKMTAAVAKVQECRAEVLAHPHDKAKWDKVLGYLEVLSKAWMEERQASWSQDVALSAMRSGFRDFAREIVTHIGGEVKQLRDNVGKFCEGAIQGAKAAAAVEGEARPRKDPVKLKFPDAYGGKKDENFDDWEASVNSYIYLQHILMEEQVLVAFEALKDEAASFARSLARTAGCENNLVAYSKVTPLSQFRKLLKERFADPTRGIRASDKLQTIHSQQWRSAKALKGTMDDLVAVPDHGVTEPQLAQLFYRAIPEALRGHFFDKSQQAGMTYDALSRKVVLYESKSMPVTTFWHKDLEKGKKWKDRTISGQVKAKDHLILTLEEGGTEEVPYDQIEWGLGEEYSSVGQGRSYAAVAAGGRPQGRGGGQGQRGQTMGGRGPGAQGVGGQGNRQAGGEARDIPWLTNVVKILVHVFVFRGQGLRPQGTSVATPIVAGMAAIVRQYFRQGYYPSGMARSEDSIVPSGALIKAILIHSAQPMEAYFDKSKKLQDMPPPPNNIQGFGRPALENVLVFNPSRGSPFEPSTLYVRIGTADKSVLTKGVAHEYKIYIYSSVEPLRATLVWMDPPAAANALRPVINDLDLSVTAIVNNKVFYPNGLNNVDDLNNVEVVHVGKPAIGNYTVKVAGSTVNTKSQPYALVITGSFHMPTGYDEGDTIIRDNGNMAPSLLLSIIVLSRSFVISVVLVFFNALIG
ncbi:hypothetical protein CBR_g24081 [Chara braunii]|uniref:Peptidase S8/S53 domain-containing protein n=1 Tax=Chara braunii TaxID=69332 RepID=A0A388L5Q6_CHABU|nr:hypothetical protein CBR_g24081 [Chara braunii]|eukprot:GBG77635.1 hypothetical protein CBR_g24081 [Chara braunii]